MSEIVSGNLFNDKKVACSENYLVKRVVRVYKWENNKTLLYAVVFIFSLILIYFIARKIL